MEIFVPKYKRDAIHSLDGARAQLDFATLGLNVPEAIREASDQYRAALREAYFIDPPLASIRRLLEQPDCVKRTILVS